MRIAVFYHCLFYHGDPPELRYNAAEIVNNHMILLKNSGLEAVADHIIIGINGGEESVDVAKLILPAKAKLVFHGLKCRNENLTILEIEKWLPDHPDFAVLYFHSKGATHKDHDPLRTAWRGCMTRNCVSSWIRCFQDLKSGFDSVGCHWMTGKQTPPGQSIWAGNYWWAKSDFLRTLPSIMLRDRIKVSGIEALESRYEAEVWIGNGPKLPIVKDYHGPMWDPSKAYTCRRESET